MDSQILVYYYLLYFEFYANAAPMGGHEEYGVSYKTNECLYKGMYSFNDECKILPDKESCASDEWLVLDRYSDQRKPTCKKRPCKSDDEVWWREINGCENIANIQSCGKGFINITINEYGEGVCVCDGLHGTFKNRIGCYELYQRGPCAEDEVVTYENGYGICTKDLCLKQNNNKLKDDSRKYFAPFFSFGRLICGELGNKRTCQYFGRDLIYQIDIEKHILIPTYIIIPTCSNDANQFLPRQNKRYLQKRSLGDFPHAVGSKSYCVVHMFACRIPIKTVPRKPSTNNSMTIVNRQEPIQNNSSFTKIFDISIFVSIYYILYIII